ncbi:MAG: PQQ-binding-like beta-propeller repeat protein [Haloarculaceae archaeon]
MTRRRTRRAFLRAGFASGTVLVAGCSSGEELLGETDDNSTPTTTQTESSSDGGDTSDDPEQSDDGAQTDDESPDVSLGELVWPMARYDAAGTGHNRNVVGPAEEPTVQWNIPIDGEPVTEPIASESTIFVATSEQLLYAFSTADGSLRWSTFLEGTIGTPALGDGKVFVPHAGITAFDPVTGDEHWHYPSDGTGALTPALYERDQVFAGLTDKSGTSQILAFSSSGQRQWEQSNLSVGTGGVQPTSLSSDGVRLYVTGRGPGTVVLNQRRGDREGTLDIESKPGLAIGREVLAYGGNEAGIRGRNDESRRSVLNNKVRDVQAATAPLITDDFVVWCTDTNPNGDRNGMMAFDLDDDTLRWTEGFSTEMPHAPVASSDHIYGTGREWLYCTASTGADVWRMRPGGEITSEMAIGGGKLYLGVEREAGHRLIALGNGD